MMFSEIYLLKMFTLNTYLVRLVCDITNTLIKITILKELPMYKIVCITKRVDNIMKMRMALTSKYI